MRPFGCSVTILNTIDYLGKFDGNADEGFFVSDDEKKVDENPRKDKESIDQEEDDNVNSTKNVNAASTNKINTIVKTASTPIGKLKPAQGMKMVKKEDGEEVDVHMYRSMIGSLMYLTSSRPNIMFAVCACARYQVNPKVSHLFVVKRIFRHLKGQPKLGLWYPKDSPFDLVAYTNSNYAGASLDMKSPIGGCQFLGCRLISWQCKK
ncbi:hypothetical protein Tco_1293918 [Tanacetum coccineum]